LSLPTCIDLFSGAGGLSLGLRNAGIDLCLAVDNDKWSLKTYACNLGDHLLLAKVEDLTGDDILSAAGLRTGELDLLAGGPPCQGFSVQRRGADDDPRNRLVLEYLRLVRELRPRFFLMENVEGLLSKRGRHFMATLIDSAAQAGYHVQVQKLDAVSFGVPQFRVRAFVVGELLEAGEPPRFRFPEPGEAKLTVREAIGDLPSPPADGSPHPDIANHYREKRLSPTNLIRLKHIPEGGGREHLPEHLQLPGHKSNPSHRHLDVYGRLAWDEPSVTLTARFDSFTRGKFGHPIEDRSLTLREGARIQTFPDGFEFIGNREECAKQIGNAVPPVLAAQLGQCILDALRADSPTRQILECDAAFQLRLPT
jgi:DNA (cytosine-5)-methyltransferase 1